jgi:hypothetical protein
MNPWTAGLLLVGLIYPALVVFSDEVTFEPFMAFVCATAWFVVLSAVWAVRAEGRDAAEGRLDADERRQLREEVFGGGAAMLVGGGMAVLFAAVRDGEVPAAVGALFALGGTIFALRAAWRLLR